MYSDCAYAAQHTFIQGQGAWRTAQECTNKTVRKGSISKELERLVNRATSRVGARFEHVFGVVERLWGFDKVRYRGLTKNATRAFVATALANISSGAQTPRGMRASARRLACQIPQAQLHRAKLRSPTPRLTSSAHRAAAVLNSSARSALP